jgi:hypothetical protein
MGSHDWLRSRSLPHDPPVHRLGGVPHEIQNSMEAECELVRRGEDPLAHPCGFPLPAFAGTGFAGMTGESPPGVPVRARKAPSPSNGSCVIP